MSMITQKSTLRALLIGAIALPAFSPGPGAAAESGPEVYAKDLEFLLPELERQAGHFFKLKGVDWPAVGRQFREEVKSVKTDAEHVKLCGRLLARLRDGHAQLGELKVKMPDESKGRSWTGPRVQLLVVGEKVYVRQAFGTAAQQGIQVGQEVSRIDGLPALKWLSERLTRLRDTTGYSTEHQGLYAACHWGMADWAGTDITFEVLKEGQPRSVRLTRQGGPNFVPLGPIFPPARNLKRLGRQSYGLTQSGLGYIHLRDVPGNLPEQLDTMLEAIREAPALILDMRANGGGGGDHMAIFGRFVGPGKKCGRYASAGRAPYDGPMVLIVDAGTRSAGETVSGMLKEDGRAYMIGDSPTAGMSSQKETVAVPSGLFKAYFSVRSNMGRFNGGRGIEGIGVPPHEIVPYQPADLVKGIDTQIRRAEELLKKGLPKDQVRYEALRR